MPVSCQYSLPVCARRRQSPTLLASVHRSLATSLLRHLFASFLVCVIVSAHSLRNDCHQLTCRLLQLVCLVILVLLNLLLLWLLVVDRVGSGCVAVSQASSRVVEKDLPPAPDGIFAVDMEGILLWSWIFRASLARPF